MIQIPIVNKSGNPLPFYATAQSAGMDLCAALPEPIVLAPGDYRLVPTGLFIELPAGYEAQIRPRSGLAFKHGVTVLNAPGMYYAVATRPQLRDSQLLRAHVLHAQSLG